MAAPGSRIAISGQVTHVEIRGPSFKGSLKGGHKTLFRFARCARASTRLVIAEAPIDASSVAAIEELRTDTLYVATGGGMGPGTIDGAAGDLRGRSASDPGAVVESAVDANRAGDRYAERHAEIARDRRACRSAGCGRPEGLDWNDVLKQGRGP